MTPEDRRSLAYSLREQGLTFKEIGKRMGIGPARARQIYGYAERLLTRKPHWTDGLSTRAANIFNNLNLESRDAALAAYQDGRLCVGPRGPHWYGWTCHKEVAKWLGLPEPMKPTRKKPLLNCPECGHRLR